MPFWRRTPRPRTSVPELVPLVHCWSLSKSHHEWSPGASDEEINRAEDSLKRRLPTVLRAIYEMSNGLGLVGGNLNFVPLESSDNSKLTLVSLSSMMRESDWSVPEEFLVFGDDGGDSQFGLWLPEGEAFVDDYPVIELVETEVMAIAGTSLCRFLKGRTAFYLLAEGAAAKSLDALGLPSELRTENLDDDNFVRITQWADPGIPDPLPDPYKGVTADELRVRFNSPTPPPIGS
ncbi:MAG: SMI1/KNR4 family protein [Planctomycetes bacterium]|nr:SMI1/KNR4 family protein [Planctomycetota bacterium]